MALIRIHDRIINSEAIESAEYQEQSYPSKTLLQVTFSATSIEFRDEEANRLWKYLQESAMVLVDQESEPDKGPSGPVSETSY